MAWMKPSKHLARILTRDAKNAGAAEPDLSPREVEDPEEAGRLLNAGWRQCDGPNEDPEDCGCDDDVAAGGE